MAPRGDQRSYLWCRFARGLSRRLSGASPTAGPLRNTIRTGNCTGTMARQLSFAMPMAQRWKDTTVTARNTATAARHMSGISPMARWLRDIIGMTCLSRGRISAGCVPFLALWYDRLVRTDRRHLIRRNQTQFQLSLPRCNRGRRFLVAAPSDRTHESRQTV
jgi:hypothetical protein